MARTSPYDPMTEEDKLGWDKTTTKQGIGAARAAYAAQNPPNPPPPQPPARPVDRPTWGASMGNYGTETPMTRVAGMPMPKVDAAKIGFDPAVTRGLLGARMANEAAAAAEAEAARQAQLGRWGQRNQAEVGRIGQTGPVNYTRQEGATIDELMTRRGQRSGVAKAFDADIGAQEARILGLKGSLEALRTEYADAGKAGRAETDPFMQAIYSKQRELLTQKATDYQSRLSLAEELAQQSAASRGKAQADAAKAQEELLGIRRNEFGDGRLPNAPQDSALANSASEMSRSQQAKQQELLAEQQEIKGRAQRGNRELLPDEVTRLEAIDTEFKNNQANPDTMSPQRGNVRAEERAAKINDVVEPVKETVEDIKRKTGEAIDAGRAKVADGVQAAADAVKPNRPDNPNTPDVDESRTPGTDPDTTNREGIAQATQQERVKTSETPGSKEPGAVERIANRFRRGGQRFVNIAAGTAANDALNEMNQIEGAAKTKAKDDASLMRKVNRMTPEAASKFIADNPNISDNLKSILTERVNGKQIRIAGAKEGLFKTVVNLPGDAVRATGRGVAAATKAARQGTKAMAKTGGKAGFATALVNIGNLYARNTSETDSALEGAKMTGGQLWDSAVNAFEKGKEIWNVSPDWKDAAAQYASAIGGDVAEGISQLEKGAKADARWWDQNVQQPFGPGYVNKPFYQIYDEEMAKGDTLGLDNVAKGLADNRAKHLAWMKDQALFDSPEGAEAPVQLAPSSPQRDWTANVVGPVTDVTDQYQAPPPPAPARGLAATRQPAAPAPLRYDPARGVYYEEGAYDRPAPQVLRGMNVSGGNAPSGMQQALDYATMRIANGNATKEDYALASYAMGGGRGGIGSLRQQAQIDQKTAERADQLLEDYFNAEDPQKREAATTKLTGIMENDPQSPLAMALMTRAANLSQQNLGPLEGMLADTANTPFGTTNPMAFEGPLTEQTGNWFDPNGYYDRNGNFVGNPEDLQDPAQQQQLRTLYNLYNRQRYGGSDPQANAGPTAEELMAMAQEQQQQQQQELELDKANRKRSGLRRQQGEQWLQQMLYA